MRWGVLGWLPWVWLAHQWWFIGALLVVGLLMAEIAAGLATREGHSG